MPHQCVRCGQMYGDGSKAVLQGCACGAKLFFFISKAKLEEGKKLTAKLSIDQKVQIEKDVRELIGLKEERAEEPVVLDLESIRVHHPGSYELDLVNLFKKQPLIYRLEEGKYIIDLPESFKRAKDSARTK